MSFALVSHGYGEALLSGMEGWPMDAWLIVLLIVLVIVVVTAVLVAVQRRRRGRMLITGRPPTGRGGGSP